MHDTLGLAIHLHFLLGVVVVRKDVDLWNQVIHQLVSEFVHGRLLSPSQLFRLLYQLRHTQRTCTTGSLIRGHVYTTYVRKVFYRLECHHHLNRCTVRIGDDIARVYQGIIPIYLRHHEGNVFLHTESTGIIDHQSAMASYRIGKSYGRIASGRTESDVYPLEIIVVLQFANHVFLTLEGINASGTSGRAEKIKSIYGKIALGQYSQKLLSNSSANADNSYFHFLLLCIFYLIYFPKTRRDRLRHNV